MITCFVQYKSKIIKNAIDKVFKSCMIKSLTIVWPILKRRKVSSRDLIPRGKS